MDYNAIFKKFCKNSKIPACNYLLKKSNFERFFWILCLLIGFITIVYITVAISSEWSSEAVYITMYASSLKITDVEFPGVALCDLNKISKYRATLLAKDLMIFTNNDFEKSLHFVRLLGNLYDSNIYGASDLKKLQEILNLYDNGTTEKDLIMRLATLISPCHELLHNCSWDSTSYNCADLFQMRLTDSGLCCVFNYIRFSPEATLLNRFSDTIAKDVPKNARKFLGSGVRKGLSFTVTNNISDYFYTSMATRGSFLKIFLPGDFPDLSSGSLKQIIVREQTEAFVDVEANTLQSHEHVRYLPIKQRKCKFTDEGDTDSKQYTSSNCFVSCKLKSILALCNCIPILTPFGQEVNRDDIGFCNLVNISCLNRYKGKWSRYYPSESENDKELSLEQHDSLSCQDCLPNCNDVTYGIQTNYYHYLPKDPLYINSSRIHVFSNKKYTNLYRKFVTVTWYEALSTFGGIASILLGISIINIVEIVILLLKLVLRKVHF